MILAHRDGNISLLSLVDLDNIHEISRFSISSPIGADVDTVSLATGHKGHPVLVVSMHGSPRRYLHILDSRCRADQLQAYLHNS